MRTLRSMVDENGLFVTVKFVSTLGAVLVAAGVAVFFIVALVVFFVMPVVALLIPLILGVSLISMLYRKCSRLCRPPGSDLQNNFLIAKVGFWSIMSERYGTHRLEY